MTVDANDTPSKRSITRVDDMPSPADADSADQNEELRVSDSACSETLDLLIRRLRALSSRLWRYSRRYELEKDSRAVFATSYAVLTDNLIRELPVRRWREPTFIVELAEKFAELYTMALDAVDRGEEPTKSWQLAFQVTGNNRTSVLEDLVCGMAVHIIHDLPIALTAVGFQASGANLHIADYELMNDVLSNAIDEIFDTITKRYNPWLCSLECLGRHGEDLLTSYGIALSRAAAWYNACRLEGPAASQTKAALEKSVRVFIHNSLHPPLLSADLLVRALRWLTSSGRRWPPTDAADPHIMSGGGTVNGI
jgi:hypothetical protein